jgi:uncharacterized protein YdeI (YjbR/CyaY-like superfamily)
MNTLRVQSRKAWREWLLTHHETETGIWLVFSKMKASQPSLTYDDAVEEALCFGWVDSLIKRLNERDYARKFTPRKPDSKWSTPNRQRYAKLRAAGLLAPAGVKRSPTTRSGDAPRPNRSRLPAYFERALKRNRAAWKFFEQLAPSYRRLYIAWIDSAKTEPTRQKRLREVLDRLSAGQKPGLK